LIAQAMRQPPPAVDPGAGVAEIAARLAATGQVALPVLDEAGRLRGVVTARDLERGADEGTGLDAADLAQAPPDLHPDDELSLAVDWLSEGDREAVPVVAEEDGALVGWLDHRDVVRAYSGRLGEVSEPGSAGGPPPSQTGGAPATPAPV
jgi:CBS domain-containing membrane protein